MAHTARLTSSRPGEQAETGMRKKLGGWERGRARVSVGVVGGCGQTWAVHVIGVQRCCNEGYVMLMIILV